MIWLTWRQFRLSALAVLVALAAYAVALATTGQQLAELHHPGEVLRATLSATGRRVLTVGADERARLFACELCVGLRPLVRLARSRVVARLR